jgi:hypothetical protein
MVAGRTNLQFNVGPEPLWTGGGGFAHMLDLPKVLSLGQTEVSVCRQINLHTDFSGDQTQNNHTSTPEITRSSDCVL